MAAKVPAALGSDVAETDAEAQQARREWIETVFVVLFSTTAILGASLLAVVTGLA
jgi:hypothetical protein